MKKLTKLAVIAAFVTPVFAHANTEAELTVSMVDSIVNAQADAPDSCKQVNLTDAQKTSLRDAYLDFIAAKKPLKRDVKSSMRNMKRVFASSTSTREDAVASQVDVGTKFTALGKLMGDFQLKVFFDLLTPEQRDPAMRCLEDLK